MKCKKEGCLGTLVRRYVGLSASRPYDPYSVPVCDICGRNKLFKKRFTEKRLREKRINSLASLKILTIAYE